VYLLALIGGVGANGNDVERDAALGVGGLRRHEIDFKNKVVDLEDRCLTGCGPLGLGAAKLRIDMPDQVLDEKRTRQPFDGIPAFFGRVLPPVPAEPASHTLVRSRSCSQALRNVISR